MFGKEVWTFHGKKNQSRGILSIDWTDEVKVLGPPRGLSLSESACLSRFLLRIFLILYINVHHNRKQLLFQVKEKKTTLWWRGLQGRRTGISSGKWARVILKESMTNGFRGLQCYRKYHTWKKALCLTNYKTTTCWEYFRVNRSTA